MNTPQLLPIALATPRTNFLGPPAVRCGLGLHRKNRDSRVGGDQKNVALRVEQRRTGRYITWTMPESSAEMTRATRRWNSGLSGGLSASLGTCTHAEVTIGA